MVPTFYLCLLRQVLLEFRIYHAGIMEAQWVLEKSNLKSSCASSSLSEDEMVAFDLKIYPGAGSTTIWGFSTLKTSNWYHKKLSCLVYYFTEVLVTMISSLLLAPDHVTDRLLLIPENHGPCPSDESYYFTFTTLILV